MTSLLIGSMTRYGQGYSFLRTRILFSYCIYILAFSKRGTSFLLSPSPAVSIASRTSVLYCSKGASLYPEGDITRDSLMEAGLSIAAGKINSIVPKDGLKLGTCNTGGSDSLGFSSSLSSQGFRLNTQIIFGSNAIEHGVNLIEERTQKVLLVSGWNGARLDPILWELEPRGFKLDLCSVVDEPSFEGVRKIVVAALRSDCGAIIAMGCGSVMESAKLATMLINHRYCDDLVDMSPAELENLLLSTSAEEIDEKGGDDSKDKILLVTVPALPSFGAELSDIVSIRRHADASRTATHYTPAVLPDATSFSSQQSVNVDAGVSTGNKARAGTGIHKHYVRSMHPDLTLVQPSLTYRAPMEMIHDRLLALIATSIDIILSDPGEQ